MRPIFLRGLKLLHSNDWFHKDIRPGNIVISSDVRLIDWYAALNASELLPSDYLTFYEGEEDLFWPDDIQISLEPSKWDLCGLGLALCYLSLSEEDRFSVFGYLSKRHLFMLNFSKTKSKSLAAVGAKIYIECSNCGTDVDYDCLESMLVE